MTSDVLSLIPSYKKMTKIGFKTKQSWENINSKLKIVK